METAHPDLTALGQSGRAALARHARSDAELARRAALATDIAIPPPPKGWRPANPGVTKARHFARSLPGRTLVNLAIILAIAFAGPPIVHAILGWFW